MKNKRLSWFFYGMVASVLCFATLNALSYFVRSGGWQSLINPNAKSSQSPQQQAIGFPYEIWREGASYNGAMIDHRAMLHNVSIALTVGAVLGLFAIFNSNWLNDFKQAMINEERKSKRESNKLQFSLRGLLVMTGVAAVVASLARAAIGARPELLLAIYLFGPAFLIVLTMIPQGVQWQTRVILLTPSTLLLIGFAIFVGSRLNIEFDRVMMGVFIFWVPQTVVSAACITVGLAIRYNVRKLSLDDESN